MAFKYTNKNNVSMPLAVWLMHDDYDYDDQRDNDRNDRRDSYDNRDPYPERNN